MPARSKAREIASKLVNIPLTIFTGLVAIGMLGAELTKWVGPTDWMLPSYLGIIFPLTSFLTLLCCMYWVFRRRWIRSAASFLCLLICADGILNTFSIGGIGTKTTNEGATEIKVASYNVCLFNFYDKNSNVLPELEHLDADIVCLQEYGYFLDNDGYLSRADIDKKLKKKFPYSHLWMKTTKCGGTYGIATYSKWPIDNKQEIEISDQKDAIYSDIKLDKKQIRVYNMHLRSNKLTNKDKEALKKLMTQTGSTGEEVGIITEKLSDAYKRREEQADKVVANILNCQLPVIVCADFNDVPVSYTSHKFKSAGLKDCFKEKGIGYGRTFNDKRFPFRIDHILHDSNFECTHYNRITSYASDHYLIQSTLLIE